MGKIPEMVGKKFGLLTVLKRVENQKTHSKWLCKCSCGNEKEILAVSLRHGRTRSCGCLSKERPEKRIHGMTESVEYRTWTHINTRCNNPNSKDYYNYGGRGIKVEWSSFEEFYRDMGDRPSKRHSIERKDVNGNYGPSNCVWATRVEQNRNQRLRKTNTSSVKGVSFCREQNKWRVKICVDRKVIYLGRYATLEEARKVREEAELKYWNKSS